MFEHQQRQSNHGRLTAKEEGSEEEGLPLDRYNLKIVTRKKSTVNSEFHQIRRLESLLMDA